MASLDSLTDGEIRVKLMELGCPVGPVTATTRKVLLKKLKLLTEQNKSGIGDRSYDPRCLATQFSSEDESDGGGGGATKNRRKSMPPPKTNKSPRRKSPGRSESVLAPLANSTLVEKKKDEEAEIHRSSRHSMPLSDFSGYRSSLAPKSPDEDSPSERLASRATLYDSSPQTRFSSNAYSLGLSDGFRSRAQPSLNNFSSSSSPKSNQPYSSEFARRLSSLSTSRLSATTTPISARLLDVKESDDEDNGSVPVYAKFSQSGVKGLGNMSVRGNGRVFTQDSWFSYDSPVSVILLVIMVLFFFILGATYLNMRSTDTSIASHTDLRVTICGMGMDNEQSIPSENCINQDKVEATLEVFKILEKELFHRASEYSCSGNTDPLRPLSMMESHRMILQKNENLDSHKIKDGLNNLKVLLNRNPDRNLAISSEGISYVNFPISFYCYAYSKLMLASYWGTRIFGAVAVIFTIYLIAKWYARRNARYQDEVYKLVSNILDIVSSKAQEQENNFVPISHVRDQLIPPKDRQKMSKMWNDAITFLESDSRLRSEVQNVEGEEFLVWRWLASPLTSNMRKVWQGQAFETVEGSVNSLPDSPTPCLKIRHMFDPVQEEGEDWVLTVADAILEKCGEAKILHIVVDKQSREGCVYLKCASQMDAGIAYRALHGSWFDSKLITVKYIREKRYLERFPDSGKCTVPLHPSNNKKKSLQL